MNIFYSTGMKSSTYGGFERMVVKLANELSSMGHRFVVQYEDLPRSREFLKDLQMALSDVVIIKTKKRAIGGFIDFLKFVSRGKINIIHANFSMAKYISVFIGLLQKMRKVICHYHGVDDEKTRTGIKTWFVTNYCDLNICPSEAVKESIVKRGADPAKISVIPHGVCMPDQLRDKCEVRRSMGLESDDLVLMSVAWDHPVKGVDLLLEAFSCVAREIDGVKLWVVGSSCYNDRNRELAIELGIENKVVWMGVRMAMPDLMSCCDIYVQASRSEGFSLASAEAMASGKPVVAFRVGGLIETVDDGITGLLSDPGDINAVADSIKKLILDRELRERMGQAGRK
jgi:glycosyltransferase involved in cell wall biosynthesis